MSFSLALCCLFREPRRSAAPVAMCRTDVIELSREDATPRKYQRLAAGYFELELLSHPPRGSINSFEQVRNSVLMLNRTIVFPRDLQRRQ